MDIKELKNISVPYDSPIDVIFQRTIDSMASAFSKSIDDGVMTAVVKAGFNVDKEKFEQALTQDKCRYEEAYRRGYSAGYAKRDEEIVHCNECRFFMPGKHGLGLCCGECSELPSVDYDWFCKGGKRIEEGDGE